MPFNRNPWVKEILGWHGHDRGGVHVPFQPRSKPLPTVIVTGLMDRLRHLAASIASGDANSPRWIFLIGGPGNGKSETVEYFLTALDHELGMGGGLTGYLRQAFAPNPLVRRRIEVTNGNIANLPGTFSARIGRLIVVQDATATDAAMGNSAKELAEDAVDLVTHSGALQPVFLACVNRGLLTSALREAEREFGSDNDATKLITSLLLASSLGAKLLPTIVRPVGR